MFLKTHFTILIKSLILSGAFATINSPSNANDLDFKANLDFKFTVEQVQVEIDNELVNALNFGTNTNKQGICQPFVKGLAEITRCDKPIGIINDGTFNLNGDFDPNNPPDATDDLEVRGFVNDPEGDSQATAVSRLNESLILTVTNTTNQTINTILKGFTFKVELLTMPEEGEFASASYDLRPTTHLSTILRKSGFRDKFPDYKARISGNDKPISKGETIDIPITFMPNESFHLGFDTGLDPNKQPSIFLRGNAASAVSEPSTIIGLGLLVTFGVGTRLKYKLFQAKKK